MITALVQILSALALEALEHWRHKVRQPSLFGHKEPFRFAGVCDLLAQQDIRTRESVLRDVVGRDCANFFVLIFTWRPARPLALLPGWLQPVHLHGHGAVAARASASRIGRRFSS